MSSESPVIRNFRGLDKLEKVLNDCKWTVNLGYGNHSTFDTDSTVPVSPSDIRDIGISLNLEIDQATLLAAIGHADLQAADVELIVVAEGSFLKNRDVLVKVESLNLPSSINITRWKAVRSDSMLDRRHGFDLSAYFVLNKGIRHMPLRPRRLGTVLAETRLSIRPTKLGSGLVPRPLTDEIRGNKLPRGTTLWVEQTGELFDATALDDAVVIYIDEQLHTDIGRLRTREAKLLQTQFALESVAQIVFMASAELALRELVPADEESPVGQFLISQVQKVLGSKAPEGREILQRIKSEPSLIAAQITAQNNYGKMISLLLTGEESTS